MTGELVLGLFLIIVGFCGNGGLLVNQLEQEGGFVPFAASLAVLYGLWDYSPQQIRTPMRVIVVGVIMAAIIAEASSVLAGIKSFWSDLESLQSSGINSRDNGLLSGVDSWGGTGAPNTSIAGATSISKLKSEFNFVPGGLTPQQLLEESGGSQFGSDGQPLVSSAGAVGIAQILPSTGQQVAQQNGIAWDPQAFYDDPQYNFNLGNLYMQSLTNQFGSQQVAGAAYNAGPNNPSVIQYAQTGNSTLLAPGVQSYVANGGFAP